MTNRTLSVLAFAAVVAAGLPQAQAQISFAAQVTYTAGNQPETTALGDFNGDGDLDAAVTSDAPDKVTIHSNNGAGVLSLTQTVVLGNGSSPHFIVAADLDGDGDLDLAVTLKNVDAVTVLFNNGGTFTASGVLLAVGSQPRSLVAVNIDGDADVDLVSSNRDSNTVSVLRNNGNGTFQPAVAVGVGQVPRHIAAGDLDGDGDRDLAVANKGTNTISILINGGTGTFIPAPSLSTGTFDPEGIAAADLDGDDDLDLVATGHEASAGLNVILVFKNLGGGSFAAFVSYPVIGQDPSSVAAVDVDLDGDLDVVTANASSANVSVLPNNGLGVFGAATLLAAGAGSEHVIAGDLTGDQVPDLVVTNDGSTTISVLRNLVANGTLTLFGVPAIGNVVAIQVSSPNDPGEFSICAFALGRVPGSNFPDGRHVPLNSDALLSLSLMANNGVFANNVGNLGTDGTKTTFMAIPPFPAIIGVSIYATGFILNPGSSTNCEQSFGSLQITFQ